MGTSFISVLFVGITVLIVFMILLMVLLFVGVGAYRLIAARKELSANVVKAGDLLSAPATAPLAGGFWKDAGVLMGAGPDLTQSVATEVGDIQKNSDRWRRNDSLAVHQLIQ